MMRHASRNGSLACVGLCFAAMLLVGCAGDSLSVLAENCWQQGAEGCRENLNPVLRALGYEGAELAALTAGNTCGETLDCSKLGAGTRASPSAASSSSPRAAGRVAVAVVSPSREDTGQEDAPTGLSDPGAGAAVATEDVAAPEQQDGSADPALQTEDPAREEEVADPAREEEVADPASEEKVAAVAPSSSACSGIDIVSLEQRSQISDAERTCLMDAAMGKTGNSDPEIQVAVISLYNTRSSGWKKAVEAALSRKNLSNAPNLNFAGIKPAYDTNRYGTVIHRSNIVWRNLKKGYSLTADHLTFVTEYACRSGLQLQLMQKPASDGLDWCERWRSRLSKAGASTAEVDDILDQLDN